MGRVSKWRVVAGVVAVTVFGLSATALAEDVQWTLYREDALASFSVAPPECPSVGRTDLGVSFHQDFFRDHGGPTVRSVVFGVSIEDIDCGAQLAWRAEGNETFLRPFDVHGRLKSAVVHTTIQACTTFPSAGACFPVEVDLRFTGKGAVDVTKTHDHVNDPDCKINDRDVTAVRDARVRGTISFTPPGGQARSYTLKSSDLAAGGATLSSEFQHNFMKGDGPNCTEH